MTTIELTEKEAALFVEFQRMQDTWMKLVNSGAFKVKSGSVTLHMDEHGVLRKIDRSDCLLRV